MCAVTSEVSVIVLCMYWPFVYVYSFNGLFIFFSISFPLQCLFFPEVEVRGLGLEGLGHSSRPSAMADLVSK